MTAAAIDIATNPWVMEGVSNYAAIPGIGRPLGEKDLILASKTYNSLLPIEEQEKLEYSHANHIKCLLAIINKHGMRSFGVHSLHRHNAIPEKTIRLEAAAAGIDGMNWNRTIPITKDLLAQDNIHDTFFKVHGGTLIPYEFAKGPSPLKEQNIPTQFLFDVANYISSNGLIHLIAIEVRDFTKAFSGDDKRTSELDVVWGPPEKPTESLTVVLSFEQMVEGVTNPVPTGWNSLDYYSESDPDGPPPGQHWNEATKPDGSKTHKVHVDTIKPIRPKLLKEALFGLGYIIKA